MRTHIVFTLGVAVVLGACAGQQVDQIFASGSIRTLQECIVQVREVTQPNTENIVPDVVLVVAEGIKRGIGEQRCLDRFGRHRQDQWDNSTAVQKVGQHLDEPVYDDHSGYEKSPIYGAAHSAASSYDYGKFHCRMTGGLYSIC